MAKQVQKVEVFFFSNSDSYYISYYTCIAMLTCLYSSQILKARSMRNHWEVHLFWRGLYFYIQATIKYIPSSSYVSIHTYIPLPLYYILRLQSMRLTALLPIGQHQFSFNGLPFTSILLYTYASRYWKSEFIKILDPIFRQDRYNYCIIQLWCHI